MIAKLLTKNHFNLKKSLSKITANIFYTNYNLTHALNLKIKFDLSGDNQYSNKTTKEIQKQIAGQKWKNLQNAFKSLNISFGLKKPTTSDFQNKSYAKPQRLQFTLQTLRQYSHSYPVYLYYELQKPNSPFNKVIDMVISNLWKAQKRQGLQFLQFLYVWQYKKVDIQQLYKAVINNFDLTMSEIFNILKKFDGKLHNVVQLKVLQRLDKSDLLSDQYSHLLKIVSYYTVKGLMSPNFYMSVLKVIKQNINRIPPGQALQAYVYFTYNFNEHIEEMAENQIKKSSQKTEQSKQKDEKEDLAIDILKIVQKRIISPQCIKFYNGDQFVALLHTFLKNNFILNDQSITEEYQRKIDTIITRIQLAYFSNDFSTKNKRSLLEICSLLPDIKKKSIIALVQNQFFKKGQKFDHLILPSLYLISHQNGMLTSQLKSKVESSILDHMFQLDKKDIAKIVWLFTITATQKLKLIHQKVQTIIQGGLKQFQIMDVSIIVWSMCSMNYNQGGKFWDNIQSFIIQQLNRKLNKKQNGRKLVTQCSWILWAYHNNRQLRLQTIDLISSFILKQFSSKQLNRGNKEQQPKIQSAKNEAQDLMSVFQLTSITSFYYSLNFPSQSILKQIQNICYQQFVKIYKMMEPIELCRCLKYMGPHAWKNKDLANDLLSIFEAQVQKIIYQDIITVVGIIVASGIKNRRTTTLIGKLLQRKKRLQSLQQFGQVNKRQEKKNQKWKFPI